jgi:hypothetical protein
MTCLGRYSKFNLVCHESVSEISVVIHENLIKRGQDAAIIGTVTRASINALPLFLHASYRKCEGRSKPQNN